MQGSWWFTPREEKRLVKMGFYYLDKIEDEAVENKFKTIS